MSTGRITKKPDILRNYDCYLGRTERCTMRLRTGYPLATCFFRIRVARILYDDDNSVLVFYGSDTSISV